MTTVNPFDVIATDLDGTFLDDDKQVPDLNAHAVRMAAGRGIPTIYASGRPTRWFGVLDVVADTHGWAVAANGALTLDLATRSVVHARTIPRGLAADVTHEIRRLLPDAGFAVEYLTQWGADPGYRTRAERPDINAPLADLLQRAPMVKLLILDPTTATEELAAAVQQIVGDRLTVTFSHVSAAGMLEISAAGVSKALALQELLDDLGLDASRMIAFGDMPNDLAMLELAGRGFTMLRGHSSLVSAGYQLAGDNNDAAVGRTILRLLGDPGETPLSRPNDGPDAGGPKAPID